MFWRCQTPNKNIAVCQHNKVQKIAKPRHTQKRRNKPGEPDIPQSSSELFCWALLLTISAVYSLGSCLSTFKSVLSHRLLPVACAINRNVVVFLPAPVSSSSPFLFFSSLSQLLAPVSYCRCSVCDVCFLSTQEIPSSKKGMESKMFRRPQVLEKVQNPFVGRKAVQTLC